MIEYELILNSKERFDLHTALAQCIASLDTGIQMFEDMQEAHLGDWTGKITEMRYMKLSTQNLIDKVMALFGHCRIIHDDEVNEKEIVKYEYEALGN